MAKVQAYNASVGVEDSVGTCRALSSLVNNCTLTWSAETPDVTGLGDTTRNRLQDGLKDVEFTFDGWFATGATETDTILQGRLGACTSFIFGPSGSANSAVLYTSCAILSNYEMTFAPGDAGQVSATFVNRTGSLTRTTFG